jgi:hypothetical protein
MGKGWTVEYLFHSETLAKRVDTAGYTPRCFHQSPNAASMTQSRPPRPAHLRHRIAGEALDTGQDAPRTERPGWDLRKTGMPSRKTSPPTYQGELISPADTSLMDCGATHQDDEVNSLP